MLEIFNKENSKFKIKVHFVEIEKVNAGMSLSLAGKNEYDERKLKRGIGDGYKNVFNFYMKRSLNHGFIPSKCMFSL